MRDDVQILDKAYLRSNYDAILQKGGMSQADLRNAIESGFEHSGTFIVQATSGFSGQPLFIPRCPADMMNTAQRLMKPYLERYSSIPSRVALVGGIGHLQAARKISVGTIETIAFSLDEAAAIEEFDPDVISCYPSIAREIIAWDAKLPSLKMLRLGGERVYPADVRKIQARFPGVFLLEQYGCAEMPSVAYRDPTRETNFTVSDRFSLLLEARDGWQPVALRDEFPELLFPIPGYYANGDEIRLDQGAPVEFRRKGDASYPLKPSIDALFEAGCVNVQIDLETRTIYYTGEVAREEFEIDGEPYRMARARLKRLTGSNKLPVVIGDHPEVRAHYARS